MNFLEEVKNLSRRCVLKEMLKIRSVVIPAPDISEFGALNEKMVYSESLFRVVTEVAGGRLFVGPSLLEFVRLGQSSVADPQAMHDDFFLSC